MSEPKHHSLEAETAADELLAVLVAPNYVIIIGRPFAAWAAFGCVCLS